MVYDYVITIKKSDYRFVDQVSILMLLLALLAFGYFFYIHPKAGFPYLIFVFGILLAAFFTVLKKRQVGFAYFRLSLLIAATAWIYGMERNIWMAILFGIAAVLERQVKFPKEIGFSEKEIAFNTFPKKKLAWDEVNNALIKDGLITIDQKNNKLFQKEIDSGVSLQVEKEFNNFCIQRLNEVKVEN